MEENESAFLQRVTYDNGEVRYPGRITGRNWLWERMRSLGYDLHTSWEFEQYGPDRKLFAAPSLLWRRRDGPPSPYWRRPLAPKRPKEKPSKKPRLDLAADFTRLTDLESRRLMRAAPAVRNTIAALDRWLAQTDESERYAYDLTPSNKRCLAAMIAAAFGKPVAEIQAYFDEIERDPDIAGALARREGKGACWLGRRLAWYGAARALKPRIVVETGVGDGRGALMLTAALLRNEAEGAQRGQYYGVDEQPDAGALLCAPYRSVAHLLAGGAVAHLTEFGDRIDLFVHGDGRPAQVEAQEYAAIESKLSPDAIVLGAGRTTDELLAFADRTDRSYNYFCEAPLNHWYSGDGLGVAYRRR